MKYGSWLAIIQGLLYIGIGIYIAFHGPFK